MPVANYVAPPLESNPNVSVRSRGRRRVKVTLISTMVAAMAGPACMTKRAHQEELDAQMSPLRDQLAARDRNVQEFEEALASARAESASLAERVELLERLRTTLEGRVATLEGQVKDREEELTRALASKSALKASLDELNKALRELKARKAEADRRIAEYRDMLARFKSMIDAGKLAVKVIDGRMVLVLPMDILFRSGSAKLSEEGKSAIAEVGRVLSAMPSKRYQVEGHTDAVPIHNANYANNWELASARSLAVIATLLDAGVTATSVSGASFAEYRPVDSNSTDAGRARNRRIEIVIVPDLSGLPGFDELNELAR